MTEQDPKITRHLAFPTRGSGGGNGSNGLDKRLRDVEKDVAVIKNSLENVATKTDIADIRTALEQIRTEIANSKAEALSKVAYILIGVAGTAIVSVSIRAIFLLFSGK